MPSLDERPTSQLMRDLLFESLRVKDEKINDLAVEILGRRGEEMGRRLVLEACSRKNRPAQRLRALRALARIGTVTDTASLMDLQIMAFREPNAEIREAAAELIIALRLDARTPAETLDPPR